ncbi:MAG: universal stress protein [Chloroflexi bacterium]|nr:universal stress protein [Chloroflexota bacterium]
MKVSRLLVPVCGASSDRQALELACSAAKRNKARVYAIYVIEVKRTLPLDADLQAEVQKGEEVLDAAERVADETDYTIETEILQAREVGPAIVDEAAERGIDVIVMGVPYKKRFGEYTLGRTAMHVLKSAPCWVWVCREPMSAP